MRVLMVCPRGRPCFAPSARGGDAAGVREDRPNLVGGELLGRGLLITLNYERFLSNDVGLGAGLMAIRTSDGGITMIPLYLSYTPGDTHSPYLSVGATLLAGDGDVQDWDSTWVVGFSAGYQYHSASGSSSAPSSLSWPRPKTRAETNTSSWPGLTIGGSF